MDLRLTHEYKDDGLVAISEPITPLEFRHKLFGVGCVSVAMMVFFGLYILLASV